MVSVWDVGPIYPARLIFFKVGHQAVPSTPPVSFEPLVQGGVGHPKPYPPNPKPSINPIVTLNPK